MLGVKEILFDWSDSTALLDPNNLSYVTWIPKISRNKTGITNFCIFYIVFNKN